MPRVQSLACLIVVAHGTAWAAPPGPDVKTTPARIVLGEVQQVQIEVAGLAGTSKVRAAVNVGEVTAVDTSGRRVRLTYSPPEQRFPQHLCLLLWREGSARRPLVARIPLVAYADVPVTTRRNSQVTLTVDEQLFGPEQSGPTGKVRMRVLVPPGVDQGWVQATDAMGMTTRKRIAIERHDYNLLSIAVVSPARRDYRIFVAAAEPPARPPTLELERAGETTALALSPGADGLWSRAWRADADLPPGSFSFRARIPGSTASQRSTTFTVAAPRRAPPPAARLKTTKRATRAPRPGRRTVWNLSLAAGLLYNAGDLVSPRLTLEAGADYPLGPGRIGARLAVGVAWANQEVPVDESLTPASASLVMVPLAALATYRATISSFSPYLAAGPVVQIVRSSSEGEHTGDRRSTDFAVGALAVLGSHLHLGPGGVFLQVGYQYARVDSRDVELLAGGLVAEVGYRLEL
jgi:hypothetical protein